MANISKKGDSGSHIVFIPTNNNIRQRGLLDPTINTASLFNSPFQLNSSKQWRWWNYFSAIIILASLVDVVALIISLVLINPASNPITFNLKKYPSIPYQHFDIDAPITLSNNNTVYHVTKEFGPATMGGMGTVLSALTLAQLQSNKITPHVILPYYSFLKKQTQYPISKTIDLAITIKNKAGHLISVEFRVYEMLYDFNPLDNFDHLDESTQRAIQSALRNSNQPVITVYLIGPAKSKEPFKKAFHANHITDIYSSPKGLPQEWKDQYFCKAVASFLFWKAAGKHELSLFAPLESQSNVNVVHLHGATNAYVAKYLAQYQSQLGAVPPAVVYTMHDYLDELQYTNLLKNVEKFLTEGKKKEKEVRLDQYVYGGNRVFMAPLGVDASDVVTFVSKTMAQDMVEGRLDFYLKEVVMDRVLKKVEAGQFFGISNGVDFNGNVNPFTEPKLIEHGVNFPLYAEKLMDLKRQEAIGTGTRNWPLSSQMTDFVSHVKLSAKRLLVENGFLKQDDLDKPLVLFVGRFQYNKGLETFEEAARVFKLHGMKFAIIGQPNNYPFKWVKKLASNYPDNIILMSTEEEQKDWLIYFRAAADFVYVPSETESFGLVAAEGLLFGASIISTGVGGLGEFLVDRQADRDTPAATVSDLNVQSNLSFNSYIFYAHATSGSRQLQEAIRLAAADYENFKHTPALHEEHVLRMMLNAYALGWDRGNEHGPVYDYLRVYQKAIERKRVMSLFDLEEEKFST